MKTETPLREVAREIAKRYTQEGIGYADRLYQLSHAIEAALNAERERAAKIAESEADGCGASTQQECHLKIAAAIRGKD